MYSCCRVHDSVNSLLHMMNKLRSKLLIGLAPLILILSFSFNSYADGLFGHGNEDETLFTVINGTSGLATGILSTSRVLGYSVTGTVNAIVGFYDNGVFFAEGGCLANDMKTVWFLMPKDMTGNLWVQVNASTTIVTIYYE